MPEGAHSRLISAATADVLDDYISKLHHQIFKQEQELHALRARARDDERAIFALHRHACAQAGHELNAPAPQ